ncbi:chaperone modulatory protein CbpM [Pseudorhodobacter antarcticus]|jgi:chaperone modulatory protein CbpM|uniref:Chaperone modulatory protein CbpM n=1 Tax=Pseudorhodobacter antarcticus TaxID=1077947 RepID=A0A1H8JZF3_9RHOB|nr:chaperone modulator CbpM [Pseudorhodobacter antarcticus]SEN86062.1 chaperone modulatory protein CbpM [Pseudorhodobacter antarcticus]
MTNSFSEDQVIATITRLTRPQLTGFIQAEFIRPHQTAAGYTFQRIDIARIELLCDLSHDLDLDETALGVVISLLDQLHSARQERAALTRALAALPPDLHAQIIAAMMPP